MSSQKPDVQLEVPSSPKKVIKFQCGLFREEIPFIGEDALCLTPEILQEYMCDLLDLRVSVGFVCLHTSLHHEMIKIIHFISFLNTHMETCHQRYCCTSIAKMIL